ncbi:MAG: 2-methylcitrate dehydratase, partial [Gammaproteobacteria bacterium]
VRVRFVDGSATERIEIEYPLGHRERRAEGIPLLLEKLARNLRSRFDSARSGRIEALLDDRGALEAMPVDEFMSFWTEAQA